MQIKFYIFILSDLKLLLIYMYAISLKSFPPSLVQFHDNNQIFIYSFIFNYKCIVLVL